MSYYTTGPSLGDVKSKTQDRLSDGLRGLTDMDYVSDVLGSDHVYKINLQTWIYLQGVSILADRYQSISYPVWCYPKGSTPRSGIKNHNKTQIIQLQEELTSFAGDIVTAFSDNQLYTLNASGLLDGTFTFYDAFNQNK